MNDYKKKLTSLNLKSKPIFDIEDHLKYTKDWRGQYIGDAIAILKPHDKYEVSKILKFANDNEISIVPQGGNTSLCGGATPLKNSFSIIISTEKMNNVISIDKESMTITLEPGVILSIIHEQVEKNDLFFPLSLGAKGSCTIGGNLSTNAGGINVLKYGNTRDLCLGLEVVLPNGDIMNLLKMLKKDNTGYDLKNIFIGAEGTLGIITAATMKLFPKPKLSITSFVETLSINNAIKLLNLFEQELKNELEAFELMPKVFWEVASNNTENLSLPFNKIPEMGVLLELTTTSTNDTLLNKEGTTILHEKLEHLLSNALDEAHKIVIGPSNPVLSIGPILAIQNLKEKLTNNSSTYVVSPFIENKAIKGPSKKNFEDLGYKSDITGIKEFYDNIGNYYIVQSGDTDKAENTIEKNILFKSTEDSTNLARYIVDHE